MTSLSTAQIPQSTQTTPTRLLWGASVLLAILTVVRVATVLPRYGELDQASGVWTALAFDLAQRGVFYRPVVDGGTYGGTRYFPLHFVLHAAAIKAGLGAIPAGHAIAIASAVGLMSGAYVMLRRLGVRRGYAAPAAMATLASVAGQWGITTIRGDLLPAALNVWGLALCVVGSPGDEEREPRVLGAAGLFVLAFAAKVTTVFGVGAAVVSLFCGDRRREALRLGAFVLGGMILVLVGAQWASHGRFLDSLHACAASECDLQTMLSAPTVLLMQSFKADPAAPLFWMLALIALIHLPRRLWLELPALAFIATAAVTGLIYASPGASVNHNIDLHVIAIIFFTCQFARERFPAALGAAALACATLIGLSASLQILRSCDLEPRRQQFASTLDALRDIKGPILFEHPMLPVVTRQPPLMLDPYMYAVMAQNDPRLARQMARRLQRHEIAAVVLMHDPTREFFKDWYHIAYFGEGFCKALLDDYVLLPRAEGQEFIYVPRPGGTIASTPLGPS